MTPGQFTLESQPPFCATLLVHMRSQQQWRLNLKCSTQRASHYNDYESPVNDIVEFSSLRESGSLEVPRAVCLEGSLESARHQQVETIKSISAAWK